MSEIRLASVAGVFYPADRVALRNQIGAFLHAVGPVPQRARPPKILIAPHAGYAYSGAIAAQAYALLAPWRGKVKRVVILGPAHRVATRGIVASSAAAFATPLGPVAVDRDLVAHAIEMQDTSIHDLAHAREHAIEVQLPFLQTVLDDIQIVPLLVGLAAPEAVARLMRHLWDGADTVFVLSSDLSHYLPDASARPVDRASVERILALQADLSHEEACGATAINAGLILARELHLKARLLAMGNSGDTIGDRDKVVGYCAVAFEDLS